MFAAHVRVRVMGTGVLSHETLRDGSSVFARPHVYLFSKAGGLEATLWYRCLPDFSPDVTNVGGRPQVSPTMLI
jgi:hypothetical protein